MLKRLISVAGILAALFCLVGDSACAQKSNITYVVPQDFDPPNLLTFRRDGETRTTDDQGVPLTGRVLLENGLELHGRIPSDGGNTFEDIVEVQIFFTFAGEVNIRPEARFGFEAWRVFDESEGRQRFFRFLKMPKSAPINDAFDPNPQGAPDESFALLLASVVDDPNNTFAEASFVFRAFTRSQGLTFGLSVSPGTVGGGATPLGTVFLSQSRTVKTVFSLGSDSPFAIVPSTVTIPAGSTEASFTIRTFATTSTQVAHIAATLSNRTKRVPLTIHPPIKRLTVSPATVAGGCKKTIGKVLLNGPASVDLAISLSENHPAASLPVSSLTIPAGAISKTFSINTEAVTLAQKGTIKASHGGVSKSATLNVRPIAVASVFLDPTTVIGPATVKGLVTLECPAAPGDIVVALASSDTSVAVPDVKSITIPKGESSGTFTVRAKDVAVTSWALIKAKAQNTTITKVKKLVVK